MKKLGCLLLVLAVPVLLFFGIVVFVIDNTDHSSLTDEVDVVVSDTEEGSRRTAGRGWEVTYSYQYRGQRYGAESWLTDDFWDPATPLVACVDPDEPAEHAIKIHADDRCGQEVIPGPGTESGTPGAASGQDAMIGKRPESSPGTGRDCHDPARQRPT